jgi:hypothetical protein
MMLNLSQQEMTPLKNGEKFWQAKKSRTNVADIYSFACPEPYTYRAKINE